MTPPTQEADNDGRGQTCPFWKASTYTQNFGDNAVFASTSRPHAPRTRVFYQHDISAFPQEHKCRQRGQPSRADVLLAALRAAHANDAVLGAVLSINRRDWRSLKARKAAWAALRGAGCSVRGIARVWGCHHKPIYAATKNKNKRVAVPNSIDREPS